MYNRYLFRNISVNFTEIFASSSEVVSSTLCPQLNYYLRLSYLLTLTKESLPLSDTAGGGLCMPRQTGVFAQVVPFTVY